MKTSLKCLYCVSVVAMLLLTSSQAMADFATPFVETTPVGETSKEHGYIVSLGPQGTHVLVIVMTDQLEHLVLRGVAEKGVVQDSMLGRRAIIQAKVLKKEIDKSKNLVDVELKITRVWLYAERPNHGAEGKTSGKEEPTLGVPGGVKITGPTAANAPGPLTIDLILAEGMREVPSIWIGYEQLSKDAVRERARRLLRASPALEVAIRADRAMPYESVAELQELLKTVGAKNVSLAVFPIGSVFAIAPGAGRDGTIRGKVIAPDMPGEPVFVTLDNEEWTNRGWLPSTSMEVAVGEMFEVRNLPAGKFTVRTGSVTAPGQDVGVAARRAEAEVIVKNKQVVEIELSFDD